MEYDNSFVTLLLGPVTRTFTEFENHALAGNAELCHLNTFYCMEMNRATE